MAAQSIASRPRRPQQVEPDDVVMARALQAAEWAKRNTTLLATAGVTILVVVAGLLWYRADRERRMDAAAVAFLQVEQSVYAGDETGALRDLQLFLQQHGSTPYGDEARVLLGHVHLTGNRPAEAIEVLRPVADRIDRSAVGAQAALLLASAQEQAGQPEAAVQTYLRVADRAEMEYRRQEGLLSAAAVRQQMGDHGGAAEIYRRLVEMTEPNTADRLLFEMRLAEAEARAAQR